MEAGLMKEFFIN